MRLPYQKFLESMNSWDKTLFGLVGVHFFSYIFLVVVLLILNFNIMIFFGKIGIPVLLGSILLASGIVLLLRKNKLGYWILAMGGIVNTIGIFVANWIF